MSKVRVEVMISFLASREVGMRVNEIIEGRVIRWLQYRSDKFGGMYEATGQRLSAGLVRNTCCSSKG